MKRGIDWPDVLLNTMALLALYLGVHWWVMGDQSRAFYDLFRYTLRAVVMGAVFIMLVRRPRRG